MEKAESKLKELLKQDIIEKVPDKSTGHRSKIRIRRYPFLYQYEKGKPGYNAPTSKYQQ